MLDTLLYLTTVLVWGSTWFAIKFQLGIVPPMVSVGYRFALAALILFAGCLIRGSNLRFSWKDHPFMMLMGLFLFCLNYHLAYFANQHLTSGMNAVIFSSILVFNMINGRLFFGTQVTSNAVIGALMGLTGIGCIFWSEFSQLDFSRGPIIGLLLSMGGAISGSFGNMVSLRNQKRSLPIMETNAFAMAYGAFFTFLFLIFNHVPFVFDPSFSYISSLLYLSIFGTIVAFGIYLTLLSKIGIEKTSYALVLTPIVALIISSIMETFVWSTHAMIGILLVLTGNILIRKKTFKNSHSSLCKS